MGEFQSGQMGQTVNLLAKPSEVRILPLPLVFLSCGSSSFGRATAFQAVGGGFEPRFPLIFYFFHFSQTTHAFTYVVLFRFLHTYFVHTALVTFLYSRPPANVIFM